VILILIGDASLPRVFGAAAPKLKSGDFGEVSVGLVHLPSPEEATGAEAGVAAPEPNAGPFKVRTITAFVTFEESDFDGGAEALKSKIGATAGALETVRKQLE